MRPCFRDDGKTPELNEIFANLAISGAMTSADVTVIPVDKVRGLDIRETTKKLFAANGSAIPVVGEVTVTVVIAEMRWGKYDCL